MILIKTIRKEIKRLLGEDYSSASAPSLNKIKSTIDNNWYAAIYYDGPKPGFRLIEPHVLGQGYISSKTGELLYANRYYVRAYVILDTQQDLYTKLKFKQDRGMRRKSVSLSGKKLGWRLMRVDRITKWQPIRKVIKKNRIYYNPKDKMLNKIIANV
jgi:hypothetical protein